MRSICGDISRSRSASPSLREIEQPLPAVLLARPLIDIALLDQFAQHPAEALLGDAENVEQLRHRHAGIAADEMHDAMMRAPEAEFGQDGVGIGDEIAIGEEQQLDQADDVLVALASRLREIMSAILTYF